MRYNIFALMMLLQVLGPLSLGDASMAAQVTEATFKRSTPDNDLIADEDPSKGWAFCNHTKFSRIEVAVGYTLGARRVSVGWRSALKNTCNKPVDGVRPNNLSFYAVARDKLGKIVKEWKGSPNAPTFCISESKKFEIVLENSNNLPTNCKRLIPFTKLPPSNLPLLKTQIK